MSGGEWNWIANYICGIADDVLRDLYVRGKYRDVILPMTVLRRFDAVLEGTKQAVLDMKASLDGARVVERDPALRQAAGQAFYNTSRFTLRDLRARANRQQLTADFTAYLDGVSPNVQDILDNFEFPQPDSAAVPRRCPGDAHRETHLARRQPEPRSGEPHRRLGKASRLDNHGMATIFKELVRRFSEENNEEAGEHWTPRDAVRVMAKLVFQPIADQITSGTYLLNDGACGTGRMLTVVEEPLQELAANHGKEVVHSPARPGDHRRDLCHLHSRPTKGKATTVVEIPPRSDRRDEGVNFASFAGECNFKSYRVEADLLDTDIHSGVATVRVVKERWQSNLDSAVVSAHPHTSSMPLPIQHRASMHICSSNYRDILGAAATSPMAQLDSITLKGEIPWSSSTSI